MTRRDYHNHYINLAEQCRQRGDKKWSRFYAKFAIRIMEGR